LNRWGGVTDILFYYNRIQAICRHELRSESLRSAARDERDGSDRFSRQVLQQIKALESHRNEKRRSLFDAQDEVDRQRDRLIAEIERKLVQNIALQSLFQISWSLS
jgi:hypothetical protein